MKRKTKYRIALSILYLILLAISTIQHFFNQELMFALILVFAFVMSFFLDHIKD